MNKKTLPICLCAFLSIVTVAKAGPEFSIIDSWMLRPIQATPEALPVDDALIALSKASSANLVADATHIEGAKMVEAYANRELVRDEASPNSLLAVTCNLAIQAQLSYDRSDDDTLVFWPKPKAHHLVNLIVAYQKQLNSQLPGVDEEATLTSLQQFLQEKYQWKFDAITLEDKKLRAQGLDESIPLAELPAPLRSQVVAELYAQIWLMSQTPMYQAFDMAFWKDARVRMVRTLPNKMLADKIKALQILAPYNGQLRTQQGNQYNEQFIVGFPSIPLPGVAAKPPMPLPEIKARVLATAPVPEGNIAPVDEAGPVVPPLNLAAEPQLQKSVAFSVKRKPLTDFVADLQKLGGVSLQLAPKSFEGSLVTANSKGMTLSAILRALGRLYSAHWTKEGQTYVLVSDNLDELHLLMAQEGFNAFYDSSDVRADDRRQAGTELTDEIVAKFDPVQLQSQQGTPFSELPVDLQMRAIELFRKDNEGKLIVAQQRIDEAQNEVKTQDVRVRLGTLPRATPHFYGNFYSLGAGEVTGLLAEGQVGFGAYTGDSRYLVTLFPFFTVHKPDENDEIDEKSRLAQEAWDQGREARQQARRNAQQQ